MIWPDDELVIKQGSGEAEALTQGADVETTLLHAIDSNTNAWASATAELTASAAVEKENRSAGIDPRGGAVGCGRAGADDPVVYFNDEGVAEVLQWGRSPRTARDDR